MARVPGDHGAESQAEHDNVEQKRAGFGVGDVHIDHPVEVDFGAAGHLPETADAGFGAKTAEVMDGVGGDPNAGVYAIEKV